MWLNRLASQRNYHIHSSSAWKTWSTHKTPKVKLKSACTLSSSAFPHRLRTASFLQISRITWIRQSPLRPITVAWTLSFTCHSLIKSLLTLKRTSISSLIAAACTTLRRLRTVSTKSKLSHLCNPRMATVLTVAPPTFRMSVIPLNSSRSSKVIRHLEMNS